MENVLKIFFISLVLICLTVQACKSNPVKRKEFVKTIANNKGENMKSVQAQMRNVNFHIDEDIVLVIKNLRGELIPVQKEDHPVFDNKESFILNIYSAEISIDTKSLSGLLNRYVFGYEDSPLKDLKISTAGNHLKQEGEMKGIPFSVLAEISATPQGKIKLHPVEMKAVGIEVDGLMKFFKLQLDEMIKLKKNYGAEIVNNDFYLDPALMLPPPRIQGLLKSVLVGRNEITQVFSSNPSSPLKPDFPQTNYMFFRKGRLSFGKLTMEDTDMQIIDEDSKDPFDFFLDHYLDQLTAGYHKTSGDNGLVIYMPDFNDLQKKKKNGNSR
jgi:hypothetical protein